MLYIYYIYIYNIYKYIYIATQYKTHPQTFKVQDLTHA